MRGFYTYIDILVQIGEKLLAKLPRWAYLWLLPFIVVPGLFLAMLADMKERGSQDVL